MTHLIYPGGPYEADVTLTNLYDACLNRRGNLDDAQVRSVRVLGAAVDMSVLSVELPPDIIEILGLTPAGQGGRLTPIEVTIRGRTCSLDPFASGGKGVVIGHIPLTALGLMLDAEGWLSDDPYPSR